ncbi:hypothetical protein V1478_018234 [Vespula squamosa]|uniref:Uncharacterized protein n=1 Tax=Vespula squamosa TaxID=30214 RepID=A0ABD1ZUH0_VESSQ
MIYFSLSSILAIYSSKQQSLVTQNLFSILCFDLKRGRIIIYVQFGQVRFLCLKSIFTAVWTFFHEYTQQKIMQEFFLHR